MTENFDRTTQAKTTDYNACYQEGTGRFVQDLLTDTAKSPLPDSWIRLLPGGTNQSIDDLQGQIGFPSLPGYDMFNDRKDDHQETPVTVIEPDRKDKPGAGPQVDKGDKGFVIPQPPEDDAPVLKEAPKMTRPEKIEEASTLLQLIYGGNDSEASERLRKLSPEDARDVSRLMKHINQETQHNAEWWRIRSPFKPLHFEYSVDKETGIERPIYVRIATEKDNERDKRTGADSVQY